MAIKCCYTLVVSFIIAVSGSQECTGDECATNIDVSLLQVKYEVKAEEIRTEGVCGTFTCGGPGEMLLCPPCEEAVPAAVAAAAAKAPLGTAEGVAQPAAALPAALTAGQTAGQGMAEQPAKPAMPEHHDDPCAPKCVKIDAVENAVDTACDMAFGITCEAKIGDVAFSPDRKLEEKLPKLKEVFQAVGKELVKAGIADEAEVDNCEQCHYDMFVEMLKKMNSMPGAAAGNPAAELPAGPPVMPAGPPVMPAGPPVKPAPVMPAGPPLEIPAGPPVMPPKAPETPAAPVAPAVAA